MDGEDSFASININLPVVSTIIAAICLVWYITTILVSLLGYVQLYVVIRPEKAQ